MTHYLNGFAPDTECKRCDGNGWIEVRRHGILRGLHQEDCPDCLGHGWRPMTQDELDDAAFDAFSDMCQGEPPVSLDEQHRAAWLQKQELRR
jgi:DnaJ-class molecular chaperone